MSNGTITLFGFFGVVAFVVLLITLVITKVIIPRSLRKHSPPLDQRYIRLYDELRIVIETLCMETYAQAFEWSGVSGTRFFVCSRPSCTLLAALTIDQATSSHYMVKGKLGSLTYYEVADDNYTRLLCLPTLLEFKDQYAAEVFRPAWPIEEMVKSMKRMPVGLQYADHDELEALVRELQGELTRRMLA